ncbi:hypothetical protein J437_LFUL007256 [Ladona fulva]|uniref:5'-Nucleotidase C-terminal domain-containing protein n=1 Tax=Ladona fulva TaxID=123851 RepID=A0A8K0NTQ5_LADFU|nr:hypothetical protein J437_LFUL007256 [Ladona fulva]
MHKIKETSWVATTKPPAAMEPHSLIGRLTIHLKDNSEISEVKNDTITYNIREKTDDGDFTKIESTGYEELKRKTDVPLSKTSAALGGNGSCSALEYGLGDLVTDAMKRAMEDSYEDGIAMWNLRNSPPLIEANKEFSEEALYVLLGKGNDENMYVVQQSPKQIASLLEKSIDNLDRKDCSSLQISGLYVDYGSWEPKGKRIKRIRLLTSKGLQDLDLKGNEELKVIVPAHLMKKLDLSYEMGVADHGVSVGEAMVDYISKTNSKNNHLFMPPVGLRFTDMTPPPKVVKCNENTGEAVVLTLAVVVMIGALGLITWYFIIPRIRQRRGSAAPLIY